MLWYMTVQALHINANCARLYLVPKMMVPNFGEAMLWPLALQVMQIAHLCPRAKIKQWCGIAMQIAN